MYDYFPAEALKSTAFETQFVYIKPEFNIKDIKFSTLIYKNSENDPIHKKFNFKIHTISEVLIKLHYLYI